MPELRWTGRGTFSHATGMYAPGERVDVDASVAEELLGHWSDGWERVDAADTVGGDGSDESTDAPFDPGDYTVSDDELSDQLADGDYSDSELDALALVEEGGQDRDGAYEAIDDARSES